MTPVLATINRSTLMYDYAMDLMLSTTESENKDFECIFCNAKLSKNNERKFGINA